MSWMHHQIPEKNDPFIDEMVDELRHRFSSSVHVPKWTFGDLVGSSTHLSSGIWYGSMKVEPELSKSDTFSSYLPSLLQAIAVQNGEFLGTPPITPPSTVIIPICNCTYQFSPPEVCRPTCTSLQLAAISGNHLSVENSLENSFGRQKAALFLLKAKECLKVSQSALESLIDDVSSISSAQVQILRNKVAEFLSRRICLLTFRMASMIYLCNQN